MTGDEAPNLIYLVLLIVLVGSSLVAMRLPIGKALKMAAIWVAIFGAAFILFAFRSEFTTIGARLRAEALGTPVQSTEALRIPIASDGHYWVDASINGREARFMVDSGASITTVSRETANAAGLETDMRIAMVETANGIVRMGRASADSFSVGPIVRTDFGVLVNDNDGSNVLGMNFLSRLSSWSVEGNYLVLVP